MATRTANRNTITKRVDQLKTMIKEVHDDVLEVSDTLVDDSLKTGAKWQKLMVKGLKGGTVLFENQQEIFFTTLEEVKDQFKTGRKRFKKLVNTTPPKKTNVKRKPAKRRQVTAKAKPKTEMAHPKSDTRKDDLTLIDGIGPKIESLLNNIGIINFEQLISADNKDLRKMLDAAGSIYKAHNPARWAIQAKKIVSSK